MVSFGILVCHRCVMLGQEFSSRPSRRATCKAVSEESPPRALRPSRQRRGWTAARALTFGARPSSTLSRSSSRGIEMTTATMAISRTSRSVQKEKRGRRKSLRPRMIRERARSVRDPTVSLPTSRATAQEAGNEGLPLGIVHPQITKSAEQDRVKDVRDRSGRCVLMNNDFADAVDPVYPVLAFRAEMATVRATHVLQVTLATTASRRASPFASFLASAEAQAGRP